jgi:hypothetical protein
MLEMLSIYQNNDVVDVVSSLLQIFTGSFSVAVLSLSIDLR